MKRQYSSIFSKDLSEFIEFRKAQGYSVHATEIYLGCFDLYCYKNPPEQAILTQEIINDWMRYDISLGYKDMGGRGRAIRTFAQYIKAMGRDAYVIPLALFRENNSSFVPFIPSGKEISSFFEAADLLEAWHCGGQVCSLCCACNF